MKRQKWHNRFMVGVGALLVFCMAGCGSQGQSNTRTENSIQTADDSQAGNDILTGSNRQTKEGALVGEPASYTFVQNFSYELFEQNIEQENPVLSPVSAYFAIGLAGIGSEGETAEEFNEVLGGSYEELSKDLMGRLLQETDFLQWNKDASSKIGEPSGETKDVPQKDGLQVSIANSAWLEEDFGATCTRTTEGATMTERLTVKQEWLDDAKDFYNAEIVQTELSTVETQERINTWLNRKTNGLIKDFLSEPLPNDTRLALFNTVYFHGNWKNPFEAYMTGEQEFTTNSGEKLKVGMMQMYFTRQQYLGNDIAEGVILPYQGGSYSFVALKPAGGSSVREMYAQLTLDEISRMIDEAQEIDINLRLPKFEITYEQKLNDSLENMGLKRAFDPENADFSGIGNISEGHNLYIDLVRQKAVIRVDEEGTEAAAVTEAAMADGGVMMMEPPKDVFFDQPFLYLIMEKETKVPLFMGIMDNPKDL
ncbi:MAG: serpin family protein [Lachnoclostridium sp.]|nr:serpin family protein [Lachnospira sp.]MCM1249289.1 serpin family protein [Lachnoclostridium sp.]